MKRLSPDEEPRPVVEPSGGIMSSAISKMVNQPLPRCRTEVLTLFVLVNYLLFRGLLSTQWFGEASGALAVGVGTIIVLTLGGIVGLVLPDLISKAGREIFRGRVPLALPVSLALLLLVMALVIALVTNPVSALEGFAYQALLVAIVVVLWERRLVGAFYREQLPTAACFLRQRVQQSSRLAKGKGVNSEGNLGLEPGDTFTVKAGELVAGDGRVISGRAQILSRKLSGAARLQQIEVGGEVYAGSEVVAGSITVEVSSPAAESFINSFGSELEGIGLGSSGEQRVLGFIVGYVHVLLTILSVLVVWYWLRQGATLSWAAEAGAAVLLTTLLSVIVKLILLMRKLAVEGIFWRGGFVRSFGVFRTLARLRTLLIDLDPSEPVGERSVLRLDLVDDRIDRQQFSVLLQSLFAAADRNDDLAAGALSWLSNADGTVALEQVSDFQHFPGRGYAGRIKDAVVTIGTEAFLVERGVQVQVSELRAADSFETVYQIALGDELVGYISFADPFVVDGRKLLSDLHGSVRVGLFGRDGQYLERLKAVIDRVGVRWSERPEELLTGGASETNLHPAAVLLHRHSNRAALTEADMTMGFFSELTWDIDQFDLSLFTRHLGALGSIVRFARCWRWLWLAAIFIPAVGVPTMVGLAFTPMVSVVAYSLVLVVLLVSIYVSLWRLCK